jgi:hypothetical protein
MANDNDGLPSTMQHAPGQEPPHPTLQTSAERLSASGITLLAVVGALILGVVFFGLNA